MKYYIAAVLLTLCLLAAPSIEAQVTSNVIERVLKIRVHGGTPIEGIATAFTLDIDGREYLITAKHVVSGLKGDDSIDVFMDDSWSPLNVKIFVCEDPVDIAVLIPPHQMTVNFDLPAERKFLFGQDAYFLGFPYGIQTTASGANGPYPIAVMKRGTFSGLIGLGPASKGAMILLDGYNNPGFSGGPIVYRDTFVGGVVMKVAGVVSGFRPEVVPVMKEHDIKSPSDAGEGAKSQPWKVQKRKDGTYFEYVDNGTYVLPLI